MKGSGFRQLAAVIHSLAIAPFGGYRFIKMRRTAFSLVLLSFVALSNLCPVLPLFAAGSVAAETVPPKVMREFRGAWIATVGNIDWPSKPGLSAMDQKAELRALMDQAVKLRLNALLLQVRPRSDAFYKSPFEPWSEYLSGQMGKAPEPGYDPLQFAVEEAHARGLELHAWFNPYRAGFITSKYIDSKHIVKTHPKWVRRYGNYLWLDPSEPGVQDHVARVILDVVRRYDIDGVHLDDYFYPYPETNRAGALVDFPDEANWRKYALAGGKMQRAEWRRQNVNKLIQRLDRDIHKEKSWVTFGISPFGIWRPGFPPQIKGFDAYERLYADARLWLINGWVDYLAPQLYWRIDAPEQSYSALLNWWQRQSAKQRPIWPGGAVTQVGNAWPIEEIVRQIELSRASTQPGYIHWNLSSLARNNGLQNQLTKTVYAAPALVPMNARAASTEIPKPLVVLDESQGKQAVQWKTPVGQKVGGWVLQSKRGEEWTTEVLPANVQSKAFPADKSPSVVAVSAIGRTRQLGATSITSLPTRPLARAENRDRPGVASSR